MGTDDRIVGGPRLFQALCSKFGQHRPEAAGIGGIGLPLYQVRSLQAFDEASQAARAEHDALCQVGHAETEVGGIEKSNEYVKLAHRDLMGSEEVTVQIAHDTGVYGQHPVPGSEFVVTERTAGGIRG